MERLYSSQYESDSGQSAPGTHDVADHRSAPPPVGVFRRSKNDNQNGALRWPAQPVPVPGVVAYRPQRRDPGIAPEVEFDPEPPQSEFPVETEATACRAVPVGVPQVPGVGNSAVSELPCDVFDLAAVVDQAARCCLIGDFVAMERRKGFRIHPARQPPGAGVCRGGWCRVPRRAQRSAILRGHEPNS